MPHPGSRHPDSGPAPATESAHRARGGRLRALVADALDLPKDLLFDLPRITLVGALQFTVENHRGLLEFLPDRVAIGTNGGRVVVTGQQLTVGVVRDGEIIVTGRLEAVRFETPAATTPAPRGRA